MLSATGNPIEIAGAGTGNIPSSKTTNPTVPTQDLSHAPLSKGSPKFVFVDGEPVTVYEMRASEILGLDGFEIELELDIEKAEATDGTREWFFSSSLTIYELICVGVCT